MHVKPLQEKWIKKAEATRDLIGTKFANQNTKIQRISPQDSWETVKNVTGYIGLDREIAGKRYMYISIKKTEDYWLSKINIVI